MTGQIIGNEIIEQKEVRSTNDYLTNLLKKGQPEEGLVIIAEYQLKGRGQRTNNWYSEAGENILLSILLYPEFIPVEEQFLISKAVSLGINDFLSTYIENIKIKWPNDIYYKDSKIAGILIENTILGNKIGNTIIGIGVNINQSSFPDNIYNATSLNIITGEKLVHKDLINKLLSFINTRYIQLLNGDLMKINEDYLKNLYLLNKYHDFKKDKKTINGRIIGISDIGRLIIETSGGRKMEFNFKEIEF